MENGFPETLFMLAGACQDQATSMTFYYTGSQYLFLFLTGIHILNKEQPIKYLRPGKAD